MKLNIMIKFYSLVFTLCVLLVLYIKNKKSFIIEFIRLFENDLLKEKEKKKKKDQ